MTSTARRDCAPAAAGSDFGFFSDSIFSDFGDILGDLFGFGGASGGGSAAGRARGATWAWRWR